MSYCIVLYATNQQYNFVCGHSVQCTVFSESRAIYIWVFFGCYATCITFDQVSVAEQLDLGTFYNPKDTFLMA